MIQSPTHPTKLQCIIQNLNTLYDTRYLLLMLGLLFIFISHGRYKAPIDNAPCRPLMLGLVLFLFESSPSFTFARDDSALRRVKWLNMFPQYTHPTPNPHPSPHNVATKKNKNKKKRKTRPLPPCRPPPSPRAGSVLGSERGPAPPPLPLPPSPCPRPPPSATSRPRPRNSWISEMLAKCWQSVGKKLPTFANTLPTLSRFSRGWVYHNFMFKGGADFCQHFANTLPTFCQHFGNPRISGAGAPRSRGRGPGTRGGGDGGEMK